MESFFDPKIYIVATMVDDQMWEIQYASVMLEDAKKFANSHALFGWDWEIQVWQSDKLRGRIYKGENV